MNIPVLCDKLAKTKNCNVKYFDRSAGLPFWIWILMDYYVSEAIFQNVVPH